MGLPRSSGFQIWSRQWRCSDMHSMGGMLTSAQVATPSPGPQDDHMPQKLSVSDAKICEEADGVDDLQSKYDQCGHTGQSVSSRVSSISLGERIWTHFGARAVAIVKKTKRSWLSRYAGCRPYSSDIGANKNGPALVCQSSMRSLGML